MENVLFKESPPSIMVTRSPNWSTEILWYGTAFESFVECREWKLTCAAEDGAEDDGVVAVLFCFPVLMKVTACCSGSSFF
jgi:hypothetical protein